MPIIEESQVERIGNPEEVKRFFKAGDSHKNKESAIIDMIASTGMLLRGHFQLESNQHTSLFSRFADLGSKNDNIELIMNELVSDLEKDGIKFDVIIVQPSAGHVIGEMMAAKMHKRLIIAEVDNHNQPTGRLMNESYLYRNDRTLVVSDIFTTGAGLSKILRTVRGKKANPVAIALFAARDRLKQEEFEKREHIKVYSIGILDFQDATVQPGHCSLDKMSTPIASWEL
jgi:orotate phosphoribosyltransferase